MEFLKIVLLGIVAAVVYGILHDQVTARVCVEYFTIGHPPIFHTDDPTLLGLGWGVIATWWVGLILGVMVGAAARAGNLPKLPARALVNPIALMMVCVGLLALAAGVAGFLRARQGAIWLPGGLADRIPADRHAAFLADLWAHTASYGFGFLGGLVLVVRALLARWKLHVANLRSSREKSYGPPADRRPG
jgi:hypothetical protein